MFSRCFLVVAMIGLFLPPAFGQAPRPNVVVILADDLGYSDLGCFGGEISTPNIDALATQGLAFTQFYNLARCCPTRAALLTGRYPHQVGIGAMIDDYHARQRAAANSPAYQDHLSVDFPTLAELLRGAGYRTLFSGKWHLGKRPAEWPVRRGFDRSFVEINGAMNYYGGRSDDSAREPMALDDQPFTPPHDGFFSTDAFTDRAISFIEENAQAAEAKPFFLYLAYNAPHWPLQASEADIAKYAGKYNAGWQAVRLARMKRLVEKKIVANPDDIAPMDRGGARPWDQLPDDRRREWARRMEVYAAQVDHMDQQIGRLVAKLKELNADQNTVVIFLSDNGAADEDPNGGDSTLPIGGRDTFRGYARAWASVSNTPFRRHKKTPFEGGVSTPLIVRWPAGVPRAAVGTLVRTPGHVIDLVPTVLALADASYPADKPKPEGISLLPVLQGQPGVAERELYWEHEGNRGVRSGKWKLAALGGETRWALYDLSTDRAEGKDLAAEQPDVVKSLAAQYAAWAERCGVQDWTKLSAPTTRPAD